MVAPCKAAATDVPGIDLQGLTVHRMSPQNVILSSSTTVPTEKTLWYLMMPDQIMHASIHFARHADGRRLHALIQDVDLRVRNLSEPHTEFHRSEA